MTEEEQDYGFAGDFPSHLQENAILPNRRTITTFSKLCFFEGVEYKEGIYSDLIGHLSKIGACTRENSELEVAYGFDRFVPRYPGEISSVLRMSTVPLRIDPLLLSTMLQGEGLVETGVYLHNEACSVFIGRGERKLHGTRSDLYKYGFLWRNLQQEEFPQYVDSSIISPRGLSKKGVTLGDLTQEDGLTVALYANGFDSEIYDFPSIEENQFSFDDVVNKVLQLYAGREMSADEIYKREREYSFKV